MTIIWDGVKTGKATSGYGRAFKLMLIRMKVISLSKVTLS